MESSKPGPMTEIDALGWEAVVRSGAPCFSIEGPCDQRLGCRGLECKKPDDGEPKEGE